VEVCSQRVQALFENLIHSSLTKGGL
jgi:hypothetical protein